MSEDKNTSGGYSNSVLGGNSHSAVHQEEGEGNWLVSYADMMTLLVGFFVILLSFSTVDQEKLDEARKEISKKFGGVYELPFEQMADRIKDALKKQGMEDQFKIVQSSEGVTISFMGAVFFETGSSDLRPEASQMLGQLLPVLKGEGEIFNIVIEGHTDDVPVSEGLEFRNNWELSSLRACRVLESFVNFGFNVLNMTAVGYGETRPVAPNRDSAGQPIPDNQSQNRRVVIKLLKGAEASL